MSQEKYVADCGKRNCKICKVVNEIKSKCPVLAAYYAEKEKKK
jgi:hypothetical protein